MKKQEKVLTIDNANDIALSFAKDILKYHELGGDMKNLTAKNVYSVLNNNKEVEMDDLNYEDNLISLLTKYNDFDNDLLIENLISKIWLKEKDRQIICERLGIDYDMSTWTKEDKINFIKCANRYEIIRSNAWSEIYRNLRPEERMLGLIFNGIKSMRDL